MDPQAHRTHPPRVAYTDADATAVTAVTAVADCAAAGTLPLHCKSLCNGCSRSACGALRERSGSRSRRCRWTSIPGGCMTGRPALLGPRMRQNKWIGSGAAAQQSVLVLAGHASYPRPSPWALCRDEGRRVRVEDTTPRTDDETGTLTVPSQVSGSRRKRECLSERTITAAEATSLHSSLPLQSPAMLCVNSLVKCGRLQTPMRWLVMLCVSCLDSVSNVQ